MLLNMPLKAKFFSFLSIIKKVVSYKQHIIDIEYELKKFEKKCIEKNIDEDSNILLITFLLEKTVEQEERIVFLEQKIKNLK